jgi:Fe-S-cluster containining protein
MPIIHLRQLPIVDSCEGCGACCLAQSTPPGYVAYLTGISSLDDGSDDAARVKALPADLRAELDSYIDRAARSGGHAEIEQCLWLDRSTRQCKYYNLRPQICRDFEADSDFCHSWRRQFGIAAT